MYVSGQNHAPKLRYTVKRRMGVLQGRSGRTEDEINLLALPGIKPVNLQH